MPSNPFFGPTMLLVHLGVVQYHRHDVTSPLPRYHVKNPLKNAEFLLLGVVVLAVSRVPPKIYKII